MKFKGHRVKPMSFSYGKYIAYGIENKKIKKMFIEILSS